MCIPPKIPPTSVELLSHPAVTKALADAWSDSQAIDAQQRHEEGGWIYMDLATGAIATQRATRGGQAAIDLSNPPEMEGCTVVAKFHTHPNPSSEGWHTGPSAADQAVDQLHGVPDLIRADDGTDVSGPNSRRGGLGGGPGFPT